MDVSLVCVGADGAGQAPEVGAALASAGGGLATVVRMVQCPNPGDRADLDRALDGTPDGRLVVHASVGDLAAVLRRLWRRGELVERETAWLPIGAVPRYLATLGVLSSLADAADVAVTGRLRTVGLLADDSGGVTVGSAELGPWEGRRLWVRAFVDDEKVCDGAVSGLQVDRLSAGVLRVRVRGRLAHTTARVDGRAAQLACDEARISSDGVVRERPRRKRTWWNEPDLWRLAVANDTLGVGRGVQRAERDPMDQDRKTVAHGTQDVLGAVRERGR